VAIENLLGLSGVGLIKEDDVTAEGDGDQVRALPQATKLLIIHVIAEGEGLLNLVGVNIPDLAGLVGRGGEDALGVRREGDAVDTTLVTVGLRELAQLREEMSQKEKKRRNN